MVRGPDRFCPATGAGDPSRADGQSGAPVTTRKGSPYAELWLGDPKLTDDQLMNAMMPLPILINRPIVVTPLSVKLCRPSKAVLEILPDPQRAPFVKEDGEKVGEPSLSHRRPRGLLFPGYFQTLTAPDALHPIGPNVPSCRIYQFLDEVQGLRSPAMRQRAMQSEYRSTTTGESRIRRQTG